jgi:hypothetical protein
MFQLQENYGLQWLHGLPDQFIMIFAWINSLYETQGAGVNIELINRIETEVDRVKIVTSSSGDPSLKIARTAVHECWRMAVLIYLYMVPTFHLDFATHVSTSPLQPRSYVEPMPATVGS